MLFVLFQSKQPIFTEKCSQLKCLYGGKCVIKNGNAACNCPDRYTGNVCQLGKFRFMHQLRLYLLLFLLF